MMLLIIVLLEQRLTNSFLILSFDLSINDIFISAFSIDYTAFVKYVLTLFVNYLITL